MEDEEPNEASVESQSDDGQSAEDGVEVGAPDAVGDAAGTTGQARGRKRRQAPARSKSGPASGGPSKAQSRLVHSCIVKLIVQRVDPNYAEPWRRKTQVSSTGTGFLWSGRRIITNAHVVRNSTHVRARKSLSPVQFSCTVEWTSIALDLAVLSVNDEEAFFSAGTLPDGKEKSASSGGNGGGDGPSSSSSSPSPSSSSEAGLELCPVLPRLDENVTVVGFPRGGQQISVTRGVVSRVDVNSHGVLRVQIDAAINPGNSGGPVFDELGRVIGIASSHMRGASNIGYIVPTEVLKHFLDMCDDDVTASPLERSALNANASNSESGGTALVGMEGPRMVPGVAGLGGHTQTLESKALRKRLGLSDNGDGGGVRVSGVWSPSPLLDSVTEGDDGAEDANSSGLLVDDVLLTIDGVSVGQDGTIPLSEDRPYERIGKSYLITRHRVGHKLELGVFRSGEPKTLQVTLRPNRYLCPVYDSFDAHSSYVVCGGCVFVPLSWPWISAHKKKAGFPSFNSISSLPARGDEQIIVLSKVLADEVNVGYHLKQFLILKSVNGKKPANIRELVRLIIECGGEAKHLEFRLFLVNQEYCEQLICLDAEECKQSESRILKQHMIASWCSEDAIPSEFKGSDAKTMVSLLEKASAAPKS